MKRRTWFFLFAFFFAFSGMVLLNPIGSSGFDAETKTKAEQGDVEAQFNLGVMYYEGQGIPQDYVQAVKWYSIAAKQGHADAQCNLGYMYREGQGVPQDFVQAAKWFRLAAEQGMTRGQMLLAGLYSSGRGVPQSYVESLKWERMAAEVGDAVAMFNLGVMYQYGMYGVRRNYKTSYIWYSLSTARSTVEFRRRPAEGRDQCEKELSARQLKEAQKITSEWKEKKMIKK